MSEDFFRGGANCSCDCDGYRPDTLWRIYDGNLWRYGWLGVLEVYVVPVIPVNLGELQFKRMALLQQDRDACRDENDD